MIIGLIKECKVEGSIELKEVRIVFTNLTQCGPMYRTFLQKLEAQKVIQPFYKVNEPDIDNVRLPYTTVFKVLNSIDYQKEVPAFMSGRGTRDNIFLLKTCLILLHFNYITGDEIRQAIDAYTLQLRDESIPLENRRHYLELNFETIQKTLRLMGKAISKTIFRAWVKRMEPFLLCNDPSRLEYLREI